VAWGAAGQFATVTPTLAVPVRLLASVMMTEIVCAPFDTTVVFQGIEVGESAQGCCATCTPSTFTVQMGLPCAPAGHTITQFVPLTVSPGFGAVMATVSPAPPDTEMPTSGAVTSCPSESVTVNDSL